MQLPVQALDTIVMGSRWAHEQKQHLALQCMQVLETYYQWVYELFKPFIGRRILDAGCGLGTFTALMENNADYILAVDSSSKNIEAIRNRFRGSPVVEAVQVNLEHDSKVFGSKQLDTVVCTDVLEHVKDDMALLKLFFEIVQRDGHLLVKVPACRWLFGSMDVASGHKRRYRLKDLQVKSERAGWQIIKVNYMNFAGVFPYWLKGRVLKKDSNYSRTFRPWQLTAIRRIVPMLKMLDQVIGPPIGQSAILIARKS
jgi:2-polyprenyl-3-methyl-5-hydroxy-6-metoxy-1,4-benzoquinol methylase